MANRESDGDAIIFCEGACDKPTRHEYARRTIGTVEVHGQVFEQSNTIRVWYRCTICKTHRQYGIENTWFDKLH